MSRGGLSGGEAALQILAIALGAGQLRRLIGRRSLRPA
jgi:hypothetical protein